MRRVDGRCSSVRTIVIRYIAGREGRGTRKMGAHKVLLYAKLLFGIPMTASSLSLSL